MDDRQFSRHVISPVAHPAWIWSAGSICKGNEPSWVYRTATIIRSYSTLYIYIYTEGEGKDTEESGNAKAEKEKYEKMERTRGTNKLKVHR